MSMEVSRRKLSIAEQQELTGAELFEVVKKIFQADFVTGLPCGELRQFIRSSSEDGDVLHVPATNERESVCIAAGAWLGGKKPILYMQNSGLFEASNDIGSLILPSKIPIAFIISWRGAPGETATQHLITGGATKTLLSSFGIKYTDTASPRKLKSLKDHQIQTSLPVCILQRRERFNSPENNNPQTSKEKRPTEVKVFKEKSTRLYTREEILSVIAEMPHLSTVIISSTGLISRSMFHHHDSPNQFYNAGGFGLTSSIGLGIALSQPDRKVVVVEGDGSVLTNLGNLNLVGHYQPKNFLHIVLDNQTYASCSGESTIGSDKIPELASILGYGEVFSVSSLDAVAKVIDRSQCSNSGPIMLHVGINSEGPREFKRPLDMSVIARRFRNHVSISR